MKLKINNQPTPPKEIIKKMHNNQMLYYIDKQNGKEE